MNEFMIARLFAFVWLGSALCSADGICAEAAGVPGVAWLAGEVDESILGFLRALQEGDDAA